MLSAARDGDTLTLTLAQPARGNALDAELVEALHAALDAVAHDDTLATLILCAEGRHFCTGLDLSDLETCSDGDLLQRLVRIELLLARLWHAPWRSVALAHGRCWGAGADLFAVCETRLAAPDTTFRFPGAQFGIVLGTRRLAERVGVDRARRIVAEGGEWTAAAALDAGLVTALGDTAPPAAALVDRRTAAALRAATRADLRDADLAALVRSAARPGLRDRIAAYRARLRATQS
ncbi:MAG: enoyl-CoA hydratase/isomerase family protein [Gammaproteobacteria bacterium]